MGNKSFIFRFADFEVREREFSLVRAGEALQVEPKAFRALVFLLRNPQRLIPKEELVHAVWGDTAVADGSVTRCIWLLRRLLGDDINEPRYIVTVATVGYRFVSPSKSRKKASPKRHHPRSIASHAHSATCKKRPQGLIPVAAVLVFALAPLPGIYSAPCPSPASPDTGRSPTTACKGGLRERTE